MIAAILIGLLKANLAAGVAVLLVLAVRGLARPRFGARAAYALWLAPLAAAVAALLPHTALTAGVMAPIVLQAEAMADTFVVQAAAPHAGPGVAEILLAAWIAGGLLAVGLLARRQARFVASLGRLTPLPERGLFRAERAGVGPAVVGVWRPRVVAPADFDTRYAKGEQALILAHESAHLAAGDALINAIACLIQCACWFNPLVHVAARRLRVDQELACDASVIGRFPTQRRAYAELLLKSQLVAQPLPFGCHWPARSEHPLKARIAMLKSSPPEPSMRLAGVAVALGFAVGAGGLAWSAEPASPTPAASPSDAAPATKPVRKTATPTPRLAPMSYAPSAAASPIVTNPMMIQIPVRWMPPAPPAGGASEAAAQASATPVVWLDKPTGADLARFYPAEAVKQNFEGMVVLSCDVGPDGRMVGCKASDFMGFGPPLALREEFREATLEMAPLFRMQAPVAGARVNIPIRFALPTDPEAAAKLAALQ
ncbi:MAG TPA: M56 family metallopeptidase [Phenylobacterium sp.]|nr:M56 family metallopeptidase [Phenylobacterium sp.]